MSKEKLELEYSLKQNNAELEKLRPECQFYKNSLNEMQETMRTKDKERYQLEQELARSVARREALELQIADKEEVFLCPAILIRIRLSKNQPHYGMPQSRVG